jgi:phenylpropionate dioxygenase-like ring-hydroxylating dioxygenase large terminal subunit
MAYSEKIQQFGVQGFVPEGWYWLKRSDEIKKGKAYPAKLMNLELVLYRGEDDQVRAFDAYCPHMGAHLCDGFVEGNSIRCPFHYWKYDQMGICSEIPAQKEIANMPSLKSHKVREAYGLVWLWTGSEDDAEPIPVIPELVGFPLDYTLGSNFVKNCHPNVVMINAIDVQHFRSVHQLVVDLEMKVTPLSERCIQFSNITPMPESNAFLRFAKRFYKNALTYEMTYWWGHTGSVMVGPDFLHFYIIFALKPNLNGQTEGQTILVTKKRKGLVGLLINPILLFATKLVGNYFAKGDTIIFSRIKFKFQTPIRADKAIIDFVEHYEKQGMAAKYSTVESESSKAKTVTV